MIGIVYNLNIFLFAKNIFQIYFFNSEDYKYTLNDLKIEIKFNEDKIKRKNLHENIRKYFKFLESEASTQKNQNSSGNAGKNSNNRNF
jgi:hypothetical protein